MGDMAVKRFWRCPVHGSFSQEMFDAAGEEEDFTACPVPTYTNEACGEELVPVYTSMGHRAKCLDAEARPSGSEPATDKPGAKPSYDPDAIQMDSNWRNRAVEWEERALAAEARAEELDAEIQKHSRMGITLGARLDRAQAEKNRWREEAWHCYVASGADSDGADARHLNPGEAVAAVKESASSYNEALGELSAAEARVRELREAQLTTEEAEALLAETWRPGNKYNASDARLLCARDKLRALSSPPGKEDPNA